MDKESIWVVCDSSDYDKDYILQMTSKAYQLGSQKKTSVINICIGTNQLDKMKKLFHFGTSKVLFTECEDNNRLRSIILKQMLLEFKPSLILFSGTKDGKYLAAVLSTEFDSGLAADCIDIAIDDDKEYVFTRAAMGDSVIVRIKCMNSKYNLCTVKSNVFCKQQLDMEPYYEIERYSCKQLFENNKQRIDEIEIVGHVSHGSTQNDNWQSANIIFGIGRGASDPESVSMIYKLASRYGAEVAATRAVVESGILDKTRQIGQSGVNIRPKVYVCFGISGACQHIVGMKNANTVIAINKDENSPIFNYADYTVVDDVKSVLREMYNLEK